MNDYSQSVDGDVDGMVRHYEYDEDDVLVADFGSVTGSVDVVDETAIVVVGDSQYEFEVPASASRAIMNNGIVTVEMER